jgi:uncharacterized protein YkwD
MFSNKSFQRVLILSVWALLIGVAVIKPADASARSSRVQKQVEQVMVAPYSTEQVLQLNNKLRQTLRLSPLTLDKKLSQAAQARVNSMVQNNYFGHVTPTGETFSNFLQKSGYTYKQAGENIAMQHLTIDSLFNAWLRSPSHRKNLVNPNYTDTGIGIAYGEVNGRKGWFVVQLFGSKL